jgi:hypothetical protein
VQLVVHRQGSGATAEWVLVAGKAGLKHAAFIGI